VAACRCWQRRFDGVFDSVSCPRPSRNLAPSVRSAQIVHSSTRGLRDIEPLHPKYRKRGSDREKARGRRYQLIAVNAITGQVAWLDARHRSHVHVEDDVKQAKALGLDRWPSRHWTINVAWTQVVALAATLLAAFRHLGLPPGPLRQAAPKALRFRLFNVPAADPRTAQDLGPPARRLALDQRHDRSLASRQGHPGTDLTSRPPTRRPERTPAGTWNPAPPARQPGPDPAHRTELMIKNTGQRSRGQLRHPRERSRPSAE
jgi:hypothetical protein